MALTDDEVKQLTDELERRQQSEKRTGPIRAMSPMTKVLIGVAVVAVIYGLFNKSLTSFQKLLLLVGGAFGVLYLLSYSEEPRKLLTTRELDAKAYEILKWKQMHHFGGITQIPQGRIVLDHEYIPEWRDGRILFWRRRVWIEPTGLEPMEFEMRQDPYDGEDRGLFEKPEGFIGREVLQKETIFSDDFVKQMKREKERKKWE